MSNEEEEFPEEINEEGEEIVIEDDDEAENDIGFDDDDNEAEETPAKDDSKEPTYEEIQNEIAIQQELTRRFNPQTGAAKRLIKDLMAMQKSDPKELGFSTEPRDNDIFNWEIHLFGFEKKAPIYDDMIEYKKITNRDYVEMRVTFPPDYPMHPPFVRVVQPRFVFHTGRVTVGGSLCTDVLTLESWNPMYDIQSLLINIFSEILDAKPRIDFDNLTPYSLENATLAYRRVARDHGWKTSTWLPT